MTTRKTILLGSLSLAILTFACARGADRLDTGTPLSVGSIRFAADVVTVPGGEQSGRIDVTYAVSHDELIFLRHEDAYRARFEIIAVIRDLGGRQVAGDSWRREVFVETYEETNARREAKREELSLEVPPGRYNLKLELSSLDTRAFGIIERRVEVPALSPGGLTLGTVVFERRAVDADEDGGFTPNPLREFGETYPDGRALLTVYADPGTRYALEFSIRSHATGDIMLSRGDTIVQSALATEIPHDFGVLEMEVGAYEFRAVLTPLDDGDDVTARARFRVVTSPKSWGTDFEKMLAQISYVASRDEYDRLAMAEPEDLDAAWEEFWRGRDPDPDAEENEFKLEFLGRLAYANAEFSSVVEGWQTDMGRVYIQYGPPDDIDSQPIGKMLHAWEVWFYYGEHTKFIFVDRDGFGEYKLVESTRI